MEPSDSTTNNATKKSQERKMSIKPSHFTAHSTGRAHTHVLESNVDAIAPKFMARFHSCELTKAYQAV